MNKRFLLIGISLSAICVMFYAFSSSQEEQWTRTELYFGLSKPDGGFITDEEFRAFTDSVIAGFYYEGFTTINSRGGWLDTESRQTIFEDSKVVIHFSKMNEEISAQIDTIRAKYKRYFYQQAVLRVDSKTDVNF